MSKSSPVNTPHSHRITGWSHYRTELHEVVRSGWLWLVDRSYRSYRRACQNHFGRGPSFFAVTLQTSTFCFFLAVAALLIDWYVPYPAGLFAWSHHLGFGLTESPVVIVRSSVGFVFTGLPLFVAVMTWVISGTRQSYLSLELLDNPRLRMLVVWFGITVGYGVLLSFLCRETEQFDWLVPQYMYAGFLLRTAYLTFRFLAQQVRRTSLTRDIESCVDGIRQWSGLLNQDYQPYATHVLDCTRDNVDGAVQILHNFVRLNLYTEYSKYYVQFSSVVQKLATSMGAADWVGDSGKRLMEDYRDAARFLMTQYASLMALQSEPSMAMAMDMAEDAVDHLNSFSATKRVREKDPLVPVHGIAGLRSAVAAYLKHHRYAHLSHLLRMLGSTDRSFMAGNPYAQLGVIRLYQWALHKAAVTNDQAAMSEVMYRFRDLASRTDLEPWVHSHIFEVVIGVIVKAIEYSHQVAVGTLLKNLVTNFEPQSIQTAVDRLLQTAESGKAILPAFPKKDLATAYQGSSVLDAIALPLSFASTQTTMQYCFLKFIILWYGQQKYVIQEHANFHPDLKRALWPSLIPAEWPGEQVLGYLLGKLRTGKHPLRFLSDSEFMRRLQADLAPRLKGRARGEQIAGDAWYPGSCAGIRSRQAGRGHEAVTASAACSRCAILGGSVGHSMLCPRYALAD